MIEKSRRKAPRGTLPAFTPVPRICNRHDGWTAERQKGFIEALADTGSVKRAAHSQNMTPEGAYYLRRQPDAESFRAAWEAALKLGVQRLEDVAMERALEGVEVPVYHFGAVVGARRVYNDRLLMFMLRNRASKRFKADAANHDANTRQELKKLKAQWRAEWEEEHGHNRSAADVRAAIDRKVEAIRLQVMARKAEREAEAAAAPGVPLLEAPAYREPHSGPAAPEPITTSAHPEPNTNPAGPGPAEPQATGGQRRPAPRPAPTSAQSGEPQPTPRTPRIT